MIEIPISKENNQFFVNAKINGGIHARFVLDTGCGITTLSRELYELLVLCGKIYKCDLKDFSDIFWGSHFHSRERLINIRKIQFGHYVIKDINASICEAYAMPTLLGMSVLNKMGKYAITNDSIQVDDGSEAVTLSQIGSSHCKPVKNIINFCRPRLDKLAKVWEEHKEEAEWRFDYKKYIHCIFAIIDNCQCCPGEKKKAEKVIPLLEELHSYLEHNLAYDYDHPRHLGAFVSAYFNLHLASAYNLVGRTCEALEYYKVAAKFFSDGSAVGISIGKSIEEIEGKNPNNTESPKEIKFEPLRIADIEGDIEKMHLQRIDFVDDKHDLGKIKNGYIGFKSFQEAFDFSILHRKRIEVLTKKDGVWHRTGILPLDNLNASCLGIDEQEYYVEYGRFISEFSIKRWLEAFSDADASTKAKAEENAKHLFNVYYEMVKKYNGDFYMVVSKQDLALADCIINSCSVKFQDKEMVICAMDSDVGLAQKLANDVIEGKYIPCAIGQMPEDFAFLGNQYRSFNIFDDGCKEDNDPDNYKMMGSEFIIMDNEGNIGYSYRICYDKNHWRWDNMTFSTDERPMETSGSVNDNLDFKVAYWQMVRKFPDEECIIMEDKVF